MARSFWHRPLVINFYHSGSLLQSFFFLTFRAGKYSTRFFFLLFTYLLESPPPRFELTSLPTAVVPGPHVPLNRAFSPIVARSSSRAVRFLPFCHSTGSNAFGFPIVSCAVGPFCVLYPCICGCPRANPSSCYPPPFLRTHLEPPLWALLLVFLFRPSPRMFNTGGGLFPSTSAGCPDSLGNTAISPQLPFFQFRGILVFRFLLISFGSPQFLPPSSPVVLCAPPVPVPPFTPVLSGC